MGKKFGSLVFLAITFLVFFVFSHKILAITTNITSTSAYHWAWNDLIGYIDFFNTDSVVVSSPNLIGYASSSLGDISLDCHTTRGGNVCATIPYAYQITNDGGGNLSDWAWNDSFGWISFDCNNTGGCVKSTYGVLIIGGTGDFNNYAWNDVMGWISFNGSPTYKVNTDWRSTSTAGTLESSIYDTGVSGGAQLNSVLWHGDKPAGTAVRFQFATSNSSSSPWTYVGEFGTTDSYYTTDHDTSLKLNYGAHNNRRYFRYKVFLESNESRTESPRIDEVIVNWSP